jgi:hypothetical protein
VAQLAAPELIVRKNYVQFRLLGYSQDAWMGFVFKVAEEPDGDARLRV